MNIAIKRATNTRGREKTHANYLQCGPNYRRAKCAKNRKIMAKRKWGLKEHAFHQHKIHANTGNEGDAIYEPSDGRSR